MANGDKESDERKMIDVMMPLTKTCHIPIARFSHKFGTAMQMTFCPYRLIFSIIFMILFAYRRCHMVFSRQGLNISWRFRRYFECISWNLSVKKDLSNSYRSYQNVSFLILLEARLKLVNVNTVLTTKILIICMG